MNNRVASFMLLNVRINYLLNLNKPVATTWFGYCWLRSDSEIVHATVASQDIPNQNNESQLSSNSYYM